MPGVAGKTTFSESWAASKVMEAISDIQTNTNLVGKRKPEVGGFILRPTGRRFIVPDVMHMGGKDTGTLRYLRSTRGHSWLKAFKLEAAAKGLTAEC